MTGCWQAREHSAALLGNDGLIGELKKRLAERMLSAEMAVHLDDEDQQAAGNHRNGYSQKSVILADDRVVLDIPRDRNGQFDPLPIPKYARRSPGFDDKIIALYARGMSTRDIQAHIEEIYGITVSPSLVSAVTEAVMDEALAWQNRPLEATYAIVYFDALRVKIRDEGMVRNKAVYLAIGVTCAGTKEILGLWIAQTEGAKFWMRVMTELRGRGTTDILIAVVDGLQGFPEAITAVFPDTVVQTCIVHLIRYSMQFASWKERKAIAKDLKPIYAAPSAQRRGRCSSPRGVRAKRLGSEVPIHRRQLAPQVGAGHPILRVLTGSPQDHLHDQCNREPAQPGAQDHPQQGTLPERRRSDQTDLPGTAPDRGEMEAATAGVAYCQSATGDTIRAAVYAQ